MPTFVFYHGPITEPGARNVEVLSAKAISDGADEITLCISSSGGNVNAGVGLYNYLRMLPVVVNTHAFGLCGSIAATLFLAGRKRTAAHASIFSLHAASYSEGPKQGQISENTEMISLPFKAELKWNDARIEHYFGTTDEKFINTTSAQEMAIIHEVSDLTIGSVNQIINVNIP